MTEAWRPQWGSRSLIEDDAVVCVYLSCLCLIRGQEGVEGVEGVEGDKSVEGVEGDKGVEGVEGVDGVEGVEGVEGDEGVKGVEGVDGDKGVEGVEGVEGVGVYSDSVCVFQSLFLIEEGALPHQVDQVMEDFGMAIGTFKTMDLSGIQTLQMSSSSLPVCCETEQYVSAFTSSMSHQHLLLSRAIPSHSKCSLSSICLDHLLTSVFLWSF